jgi:hypothetical protein
MKRAQRRFNTEKYIAKQKKLFKHIGWEIPWNYVWGKHKKRHFLDCGRADCTVCHQYRTDRELTLQEKRNNENFKEDNQSLHLES